LKPYVICHMASSIDGRILPSRWRPQGFASRSLYERLHEELNCDAWLVGRVTGQEFAKTDSYQERSETSLPRNAWFATREAKAFGVVLDAHGKIAWGRADIGGDPIVVVLTSNASDAHLIGLRSDGVSYFFAGDRQLDLAITLEILNRELSVERVLLEGGGGVNGAFLRAGLIDEVSLILCPVVDGSVGAPSVFDSELTAAAHSAPLKTMALESSEALEGGALWLRYRLGNVQPAHAQ
jgi:riboflavin biosynthesis pyrimidine reductase